MWILVKDSLPKNEQVVICKSIKMNPEVAVYLNIGKYFICFMSTNCIKPNTHKIYNDIEFWLPFPVTNEIINLDLKFIK